MLKNKIVDFFMVAAQGYETMSAREISLWYVAAIPANIAYYKLIRRRQFAPAIVIAALLVGALVLRSFTLGLRARRDFWGGGLRARRDFWGGVLREHQARWKSAHGGPPANIKLS